MKVEGMPPQAMNAAVNSVRNKEVSGNESEEQVAATETEVKEKPNNFGQFVSGMAKDKALKAAFIADKEAENFGQAISAIARQGYASYLEDLNETSEDIAPEEVSTASSEPEAEEVSTALSQPEPEEEPSPIEVDLSQVLSNEGSDPVIDLVEELIDDTDSQNESQTS